MMMTATAAWEDENVCKREKCNGCFCAHDNMLMLSINTTFDVCQDLANHAFDYEYTLNEKLKRVKRVER